MIMKAGLKRLILGVLLFLGGVFGVPVLVLIALVSGDEDEMLFPVPGSVAVELAEPGHYLLWNHYEVLYEGQSYQNSDTVPNGMRIEVVDASGESLEVVSAYSMEFRTPRSVKRSVASVEVATAGVVQIEVSGTDETFIFSISPSPLGGLLRSFLGGLAAAGLLVVVGIALIIWGAVRMSRSREGPGAHQTFP